MAVLENVMDPEIPVVSITDLGIVRGFADDPPRVRLTPTSTGCPAMDVIRRDVEEAVRSAGFAAVEVRTVLSPAWTTDWMTDEGRRALSAYGIAPPIARSGGPVALALSVRCPQCGSPRTRESSRFGSTACKSLWACEECREPFDHFKAI
jgi:ring-1,2-phenylacetyl-CoA epoxidase subunit PaaD